MEQTSSEDHGALEATIEFTYDSEQLAQLIGDLPVAGLLDFEAPSEQVMHLRVTVDTWELRLDEPTVFGSGMTLIRHRDGRGEYLDHGTRTRLAFAADDVPKARVRRPGGWHVSEPEDDGDTIEIVLEDPFSGERWIQRIRTGPVCEDRELLGSFVEALLVGGFAQETSHYPVERLADILAARGLPTEVSLSANGADAPASRFVVTYRDADAVPAGRKRDRYRDLRNPRTRKLWGKPGPGLREVAPRDLDELRDLDDNDSGDGLHQPRALVRRNGGDNHDPPDPPDPPVHHTPPPTITTNAAQVALRIEQRLLDDLQRTVDSVAAHLSGISTNGTDIEIRWLEDTVVSARTLDPPDAAGARKKTVAGTGLPAMLHEDPGTGAVKRNLPGGGRGIIDRKAAAQAGAIMGTGAIPAHVIAGLSAADVTAITTAIATLPPTARFGSLSAAVRTRLITAVAFEEIGTLRFSLAELRKPINYHDIYYIALTNFAVSVGFPAATMSTTVPPAPLEAPLIRGLRCRSGGGIDGSLMLANLSVDAEIGRTPLPLYWALLVAGAPLIPVFFPQFVWVIPLLWAISLFLATDFARLRLEAKPLTANFSVSFAPRPPSAALRPRVSVRLVGNVQTKMLSYVPTGIHQLVDWAVAGVLNLFSATIAILQGQLASILQGVLDWAMGDGVPGSLQRLGLPVASGTAFGVDDDHVYLESSFGVPADPTIRITPVPVSAALRFDLDRDVTRVFGAQGVGGRGRHYLSVAGSINAVNQGAAVLWRRGEFDASIPSTSAAALRPLLTAPFGGPVTRIDTFNVAPPLFSLPAGGPGGPRYAFDVVFPAFIVVINRRSASSWIFSHRITARGVFGMGGVPPGGSMLSLTQIRSNIFEALIDLTSVTATLTEVTHLEETTITVQEAGNDPRHPEVIRTVTDVVETTTDWTAAAPPGWTAYGRGAFALANWWRDAGFAPRLDQLKSDGHPSGWPADTATQQTYTVDGSDPDDATPSVQGITVAAYAELPVDWGYNQGLSFAHVEASGAFQQLLSGSPHLNSFTILDAELLYPFLGRL